ncbi:MAG: hypothetical protein A3F84_02170 [Candidatus Handelsmanbacteria bacterium RIFCSPLOWO2_12_FULL_64_10]|uniref:DUF218 domain-containing protein n=1 Tax=Handelsmanbacteria sp. (strain RIFCSPLOWO2_12_FULL_64_10) TaxID=1817868 RepID=A0A1F6D766_HANXR|nr:MAG: hypothetical protein A3F84_02170 [Candidatus Handelsmanbacteria bacterium RIFCSPLOWO2_12_FULL_64_10]
MQRWLEDDRFFVRREVRRLRLRFKVGLIAVALGAAWLLAPLYLPLIADPLVVDYKGLETEALVAEGWFALDHSRARAIARVCRNGQRVYVIVNEKAEIEDDYGFKLDRPGLSMLNLARAGGDTSGVTVLLMYRPPDIPGNTALYAVQLRDRLQRDGVRSFTLVTDSFHSRRSYLIYSRAFAGSGVTIDCYPSPITFDRDNWWRKSSGMQYIMAEYVKLIYYFFRGWR